MTDLTPRQSDTLGYIKKYIKKHDKAPLLREIALALGISKQGARTHIIHLQSKGYVERGVGFRNLSLIDKSL